MNHLLYSMKFEKIDCVRIVQLNICDSKRDFRVSSVNYFVRKEKI